MGFHLLVGLHYHAELGLTEEKEYMWGVTDPITIAEPTKERVIEEFKKLMKIAEEF